MGHLIIMTEIASINFKIMRLISLLFLLFLSAPTWSKTVLVVGDSISAAYGLAERDGWVQLTDDKFSEDITFVNASISGDTTSGGLARLPEALDRFNPSVVVIELGGNDGLRGYSLKDMRENLTAMVEASEAAGASVLLLGMQIPSNYGVAYTRRFAGQHWCGLGGLFLRAHCNGP